MAIRIPQNIIIESKYTIGNEFILLSSYQVYQGYYYEINGKYFVGKDFNPDAPELQKILSLKSNNLLKIASSFIFGKISGININQKSTPTSIIYQPTEEDYSRGYSIRYFYKKINTTPIIIKETNQENYNLLINDPLYQVALIKWGTLKINDTNLTQAEQQMPGLKAFLGV